METKKTYRLIFLVFFVINCFVYSQPITKQDVFSVYKKEWLANECDFPPAGTYVGRDGVLLESCSASNNSNLSNLCKIFYSNLNGTCEPSDDITEVNDFMNHKLSSSDMENFCSNETLYQVFQTDADDKAQNKIEQCIQSCSKPLNARKLCVLIYYSRHFKSLDYQKKATRIGESKTKNVDRKQEANKDKIKNANSGGNSNTTNTNQDADKVKIKNANSGGNSNTTNTNQDADKDKIKNANLGGNSNTTNTNQDADKDKIKNANSGGNSNTTNTGKIGAKDVGGNKDADKEKIKNANSGGNSNTTNTGNIDAKDQDVGGGQIVDKEKTTNEKSSTILKTITQTKGTPSQDATTTTTTTLRTPAEKTVEQKDIGKISNSGGNPDAAKYGMLETTNTGGKQETVEEKKTKEEQKEKLKIRKQEDVYKIPENPDSEPSGHFMAYFLTAVVLCVAGYVIFHNKQKIVAFIVEGRNGKRTGSRRPSKGGYSKLKPSVDDMMPSLEKSTSSSSYIY